MAGAGEVEMSTVSRAVSPTIPGDDTLLGAYYADCELKELLGHTSILRTKIYLRLAQVDLREAMDQVNFYF
jgi:hypothetical protein